MNYNIKVLLVITSITLSLNPISAFSKNSQQIPAIAQNFKNYSKQTSFWQRIWPLGKTSAGRDSFCSLLPNRKSILTDIGEIKFSETGNTRPLFLWKTTQRRPVTKVALYAATESSSFETLLWSHDLTTSPANISHTGPTVTATDSEQPITREVEGISYAGDAPLLPGNSYQLRITYAITDSSGNTRFSTSSHEFKVSADAVAQPQPANEQEANRQTLALIQQKRWWDAAAAMYSVNSPSAELTAEYERIRTMSGGASCQIVPMEEPDVR